MTQMIEAMFTCTVPWFSCSGRGYQVGLPCLILDWQVVGCQQESFLILLFDPGLLHALVSSFFSVGKKREMYEHPVFCLASQVMDLTIREYPPSSPALPSSLCSPCLLLEEPVTSHCSVHGIPISLCSQSVCMCVKERERLECILTLLVCKSWVRAKVWKSTWLSHLKGSELPRPHLTHHPLREQRAASAAPRNPWIVQLAGPTLNTECRAGRQRGPFGLIRPTTSRSHGGAVSLDH